MKNGSPLTAISYHTWHHLSETQNPSWAHRRIASNIGQSSVMRHLPHHERKLQAGRNVLQIRWNCPWSINWLPRRRTSDSRIPLVSREIIYSMCMLSLGYFHSAHKLCLFTCLFIAHFAWKTGRNCWNPSKQAMERNLMKLSSCLSAKSIWSRSCSNKWNQTALKILKCLET